jgi:hypothetical protein
VAGEEDVRLLSRAAPLSEERGEGGQASVLLRSIRFGLVLDAG